MLWTRDGKKTQCFLCAYNCNINDGEAGVCRVRVNEGGTLYSNTYGKIKSIKTMNIEKIPLYHFFPGQQTLVINSNGTNFEWDDGRTDKIKGKMHTPEDIVKLVNKKKLRMITFHHDEPTMFFEFAYRLARIAKRYNIKIAFSTNGYITSDAIKKIGKYLDAVNVEFKASGDPEFYKRYMDVPDVQPIFTALRNFKKHRVFIEISNMVIPEIGESMDAHRDLIDWVINELDSSVPYHLLRFKSAKRLKNIPSTSDALLDKFANDAKRIGLRFPYIQDIAGGEFETTYCYNCTQPMITRSRNLIKKNKLNEARCSNCGFKLNLVLE